MVSCDFENHPNSKKGNTSSVSNYRPISLLSLDRKLLERLIHNSLMDHIVSNNILSDLASDWEVQLKPCCQHRNSSTKPCRMVEQCLSFSHSGQSLRHHVPSWNLWSCDEGWCLCSGSGTLLCWFKDYFSNKYQSVAIQGSSFTFAYVTSGGPQGSILGPLLFLLTFDDIFKLIRSTNSKLTGFVDDWSAVMFQSSFRAEQHHWR